MLSIIATILLVLSISYVFYKAVRKHRTEGSIGDIRSYLSSICLFLIAIVNLWAQSFDLLGILSWGITIILLMIGSYCTKYIRKAENG
ncbi:hypothetical protein EV207_12835 [Scopulibacillus darangshiensis]|uniref:YtpI-like protein n=1 Tax=Scopulibacillus darangshiensis TaxID=442528 RepID=A0A4R2NQ65_9BACL|nr:hypothetical protein [Scopulibacillus darangshiensis]TCP23812.1 hypothetical protein EV207_12835 [Scopulibacillus darangshiensis]